MGRSKMAQASYLPDNKAVVCSVSVAKRGTCSLDNIMLNLKMLSFKAAWEDPTFRSSQKQKALQC